MNSGPRSPRPGGGGKPNNKFKRTRRKPCMFCVDHATSVDYKQMILGRYKTKLVSDRGKIVPRRTTGTCAKHQRMVTEAIKRARHVALIPFAVE